MPTPKELATSATGFFLEQNGTFKKDLLEVDKTLNPYRLLAEFAKPDGLLNESTLAKQKAELQIFASLLNPTPEASAQFIDYFKTKITEPADAASLNELLQARAAVVQDFSASKASSVPGTLTANITQLFVAIQKTGIADLTTQATPPSAQDVDQTSGKVPQATEDLFSSKQMIEISEHITSVVKDNNKQFQAIENPGDSLKKQLGEIQENIQKSDTAVQKYKTNSQKSLDNKEADAAAQEEIEAIKKQITTTEGVSKTTDKVIKRKTNDLKASSTKISSNMTKTSEFIKALDKKFNPVELKKATEKYVASLQETGDANKIAGYTQDQLGKLQDGTKAQIIESLKDINKKFQEEKDAIPIAIETLTKSDVEKKEKADKEVVEFQKELAAKQNALSKTQKPTDSPGALAKTAFESAISAANKQVTYNPLLTQALKTQESTKAAEAKAAEDAEKARLAAEAEKNALAAAKDDLSQAKIDVNNAETASFDLNPNYAEYTDPTNTAISAISQHITTANDAIDIAEKDNATLDQIKTAIMAAKAAKDSVAEAQRLIGIDQNAKVIKDNMAALSNKQEEASNTLIGLETELRAAQHKLADGTNSFSDPTKQAIDSDALAAEITAALAKIEPLRDAINKTKDIKDLTDITKALSDETTALKEKVDQAIKDGQGLEQKAQEEAKQAAELAAKAEAEAKQLKTDTLSALGGLATQLDDLKGKLQIDPNTDQAQLQALLSTISAIDRLGQKLNSAAPGDVQGILDELQTHQTTATGLLTAQADKEQQLATQQAAQAAAQQQAADQAALDAAKTAKGAELNGLTTQISTAKGSLSALSGTDLSDLLQRIAALETQVKDLQDQLNKAQTPADVTNINLTTVQQGIDTAAKDAEAALLAQALAATAATAAAATAQAQPQPAPGISLQQIPTPIIGPNTTLSGSTLANITIEEIQTQIVKDQRKTLATPPTDAGVKQQWDERAKQTSIIQNDQGGITADFNKKSADEHAPKIPLVSITKTGEAENTKVKISTTGLPPSGDALIAQTKAIHGAYQAAIKSGGLPGPVATIGFKPASEVNAEAVLRYAHEQRQALISVGIPESNLKFADTITQAEEIYKKANNNQAFDPAAKVPPVSDTKTLDTLKDRTEQITKKVTNNPPTPPAPDQQKPSALTM